MSNYNIVMFAYNEQDNIEKSLNSIFNNTDERLSTFFLIANGCTDDTVAVANQIKAELQFEKMVVVSLAMGDKCNAWNHYMYQLADSTGVHFFVDADVQFSENCFPLLATQLMEAPDKTVAVAGMPLTGRNLDFYQSLVRERACFFGNLYGLKWSFIERIREDQFKLPVGLNWIDSFLTKAVNTDLKFFNYNLPNRTTYLEGVGYRFTSLKAWKCKDLTLYINRIARYELGKIQEKYLDAMNVTEWPESMQAINHSIQKNRDEDIAGLGLIKTYLVKKRLKRIIKRDENG